MVTSYEMLPVSQAPCFPFIVSLDPPNIFLVLREVKNVSEDTQLIGSIASTSTWFSLAPKG